MYCLTRFLELCYWISIVVNPGKGSLGSDATSPVHPFPPSPSPLQSWLQHRCAKRRLQDIHKFIYIGRNKPNTQITTKIRWVNDDETYRSHGSLPFYLFLPSRISFLSRVFCLVCVGFDFHQTTHWNTGSKWEDINTSQYCLQVHISGSCNTCLSSLSLVNVALVDVKDTIWKLMKLVNVKPHAVQNWVLIFNINVWHLNIIYIYRYNPLFRFQ